MLVGHYAVALGGKTLAPKTSLGTLVAAAVFLDLLWPVFLQLGWEQVVIAPGTTAFTPLDFVSYPWSHSLLTSIGWGALFGGVYYALKKDRRGALVLGALVVSHWLLDFLMHRPDLPLPGESVKLLVIYAAAAFGPPPPNVGAIIWADIMQGLVIALAWWVDRYRHS